MTTVPMISATGLTKRFGSRVAVDGLDLAVAPGEVHGLLGPNGAGKTTTLRMLVGATKPDAGRVSVGPDAGDPQYPATRRSMGLAPQGMSIVLELTGAENVRFLGRLQGMSGAKLRERVAWSLDFVGLGERAGDLAGTYSGGMQRRLNLACAIVHDPPLLLLDEPTVGVDPQSRARLLEGVASLARAGKAVLYTTHIMEEAERLCGRLTIIDAGRALESGTPSALIAKHGGPSRFEVMLTGALERFEFLRAHQTDLSFESSQTKNDDNDESHKFRGAAAAPEEVLSSLMKAGVAISELRIERPDLEAVFFELTGRSLRDGGIAYTGDSTGVPQ